MRPIPAPRIGDSHGILRAVGERERVRLDEFLTSANVDDMFPEGLENALGRMRQFISYARAAGLLREDRGVVELTEVGKRYIRAGDPERPYDVSGAQAEWLRRQLIDKHMTDSIFHGLAIGLSLLSSKPPDARVSTLDFGRALAYLGRAGWDNENTLRIQGERYLVLLADIELIDAEQTVTAMGSETKGELTLPVHMSLVDLAGQLNPGGPAAVAADGAAEWGAGTPEPEPVAAAPEPVALEPEAGEDDEWADVGPGSWAPMEEPVPESRESAATVISRDGPPPPVAAPEAPPAEPVAAPEPPPTPEPPAAPEPPADTFVDAAAIRAAAEKRGLRLSPGVYANAAAALAGGRHLLLVGAPGAGKTSLALAIAEAASAAGRAAGAAILTAARDWHPAQIVLDSAQLSRWLVVDDLDQADADDALGGLASLLYGLPVTLPGFDGEARAAGDWRIVATAARVPRAGAALLNRFAAIDVPPPADTDLHAALTDAAGDDEVAAAAARRLLPLRDVRPLGAGVFLAAARHGAARRAIEPIGEGALTRELHAAYVAPLLDGLDADAEQRVRGFLDAL
jgi:AAA domain (dynein-related subfamily)